MGAYTRVALCHELRGEREDADRYVELALRYFELGGFIRVRGRSIHLPPLALALMRRGRLDEATHLIPLEPGSVNAGVTLEALCEIAAERGRWEEAAGAGRGRARGGGVGRAALPSPVRRPARGTGGGRRAAMSRGAAELLGRSADGFAALGARWEEAWSRLLLAEVLAGTDRRAAERELRAALPVFEQLGSAQEADRARAALEQIAVEAG